MRFKVRRAFAKISGLKAQGSTYYQALHDYSESYQDNNWLSDRQDLLNYTKGLTVLEIGCGNGQFLKAAAHHTKKIYGADWAVSQKLKDIHENVHLINANILETTLPKVDLVCSGDVLEHFNESDLKTLLPKLKHVGKSQYHVIACFDDSHSHLTIKEPGWWKKLFEDIFEEPFHCHAEARTAEKVVAVIHNIA